MALMADPSLDCNVVPDWSNPGFFGDFANPCYDNEKKMIDHLIAEDENINGVECIYHRYSLDTTKDEFYGDDPTKHAIDSFRFMAKMPIAPSMKQTFAIMGIVINDTFDITAGIAHFMASQKNTKMPPMVGDAVQFVHDKTLWSISYVDDMAKTTQPLHAKTVYTIKLRQWENSRQFFDALADTGQSDDPRGDMAAFMEIGKAANIFNTDDTLDTLRKEDETFYAPPKVELPPNNDKDNPFPRF